MNIDTALYVIALILSVLAAVGVDARGQNLLAWAAACMILSLLI
jgi:hypothetical protein